MESFIFSLEIVCKNLLKEKHLKLRNLQTASLQTSQGQIFCFHQQSQRWRDEELSQVSVSSAEEWGSFTSCGQGNSLTQENILKNKCLKLGS